MGKEKFWMGKEQKNHKYQCDVIQIFSLTISLGYTCKKTLIYVGMLHYLSICLYLYIKY